MVFDSFDSDVANQTSELRLVKTENHDQSALSARKYLTGWQTGSFQTQEARSPVSKNGTLEP